MKLTLVVLALIIGQICLAQETTTPEKAKNGTGPGRYHSSHNRHHRHRDNDYGHEKRYRVPIIDDYVCDLEATILVVSSKHHVKEEKSYGGKGNGGSGYGNQGGYGASQQYDNQQSGYGNQGGYGGQQYDNQQSGYGNQGGYDNQQGYGSQQSGYGNQGGYGGGNGYEDKPKRREYATPEALRLKCSHIAIYSEHDCQTCCQLSARRYHSVSKHDIFGFIVDADEIKTDDKGYVRSKRDAQGYGPAPPANNYNAAPAPSYNAAPAPSYNAAPAPSYNAAPAPSYSASPAPSYDNSNYSPSEQPSYPTGSEYSAPETPGYSESSYPAAKSSYGVGSYERHGPPKNARCVCCAPKKSHRDHHDRYDRSDSHSREY